MEAEVNIIGLLDLPSEILVNILCFVSASDLCQVSLVNSYLYKFTKEELIWTYQARKHFGITLKPTTVSPRFTYQHLLHKWGKLLGLWQRQNLHFYSEIVLFYFDGSDIILEEILPARENQPEQILRRKFLSISTALSDSGVSIRNYDNLTATQDVRIEMDGNDKFEIICSNCRDHTLCPQDWRNLLRDFLSSHGSSPEESENSNQELNIIKFSTLFHSRSLYAYNRLEILPTVAGAPIQPGMFQATYGPHGGEFVQLTLTHSGMHQSCGVKITGDPYVPFREVSFVVEDDRCLDIPQEEQSSIKDIEQFIQHPEFVDYKEDLVLPFKVPLDCSNLPGRNDNFCKGRWKCKCQIASYGHVSPSMVDGNLILFNEDLFAVLNITICSLRYFSRVKGLL